MSVLIDIEWTEKRMLNQAPYHKLTQISALRVNSTWKAQSRLDLLVRPEAPTECDWNFMAYSGHLPEEFCTGRCEGDCIKELFGWIEQNEAIICWHSDTKKVLMEVYRRYIQDGDRLLGAHRFVCMKEKVEPTLWEQNFFDIGFYNAANFCGAEVTIKHCSHLDTGLMSAILCKLWRTPEQFLKQPAQKLTVPQRREKNKNLIASTTYKFVYTPNSAVFHRRDCWLILNANMVLGCVHYIKAANGRRPCKVCNPIPNEEEAVKVAKIQKEQKQAEQNEVLRVRLLGGQVDDVRRKNIVGCCHNSIHPGKMTKKLMDDHDCIGKQCRFFEKYEQAAYWVERENRRRGKAEAKRQKQVQQKKEEAAAKTLDVLKAEFQGYLDAQGYPMHIVRLTPVKQNVYKVYYVSDHPFADGQLYPNFYAAVMEHYPQYRLLLRHIQDENGRFVTREEYWQRTGRAS